MDLDQLIQQVRWQYAVTYLPAPHEYTVFNWYRDNPAVLERLQQFAHRIEREGVVAKFGAKEFRYLVLGEFKYWIMDAAKDCTLINRTFVDDSKCQMIANALKNQIITAQKRDTLLELISKVSLHLRLVE